jgi:hypothetical protein
VSGQGSSTALLFSAAQYRHRYMHNFTTTGSCLSRRRQLDTSSHLLTRLLLLLATPACRYEAMIFSLACEGQHADDAYQVESMLAIQLDVGIAVGSALSLAWSAGPWAVIRDGGGSDAAHG